MTQQTKKTSWNLVLTLVIIAATLFIGQRFIEPTLWAAIFTIALWPLYSYWRRLLWSNNTLASSSALLLIIIIISVPLTWIIILIAQELQLAVGFMKTINAHGMVMPGWIASLPWVGAKLAPWWQSHLAHPGQFQQLFDTLIDHQSQLIPHIRSITQATSNHLFNTFITLMLLFFMLKDGDSISQTIMNLGKQIWQKRWQLHAPKLLAAIRGTVNGTILSGLAIGLLMGIAYAFAGIELYALLGLITGLLSMIPFGAIAVIAITSLILIAQSHLLAGILILIIGSVVEFLIEHFVKPTLIGSSTELPFLLIIIGIIGGVETLGLIGLFLGPVIMAMFVTLIKESQ